MNEIFGKRLERPILGKYYDEDKIEENVPEIEPIVLDIGLPFIPVYTHFLMFNLEPVVRVPPPAILQYFKIDSPSEENLQSFRSIKQVPASSRLKTPNRRSRPIFSMKTLA